MKATLYRTDRTSEIVTPKNGTNFTLEEMQFLVGGYIELNPYRTAEGHEMYFDEEGKLKGKPFNMRATKLSGLYPHDVVVGDALVGHPNVFREEDEQE